MKKVMPIFRWTALVALSLLSFSPRLCGGEVPLSDAGFEQETRGWKTSPDDQGMSEFTAEAAHAGKLGLRVVDNTSEGGSSAYSARVPVKAGWIYRLSFQARVLSGSGAGVYLRFLDGQGKYLNPVPKQNDLVGLDSAGKKGWKEYSVQAMAPETAVAADIWIHSFKRDIITADFDDFMLTELEAKTASPWPSSYKLSPDDAKRFTEADVLGPDGVVYPDWSLCGVPGGIPVIRTVIGPEYFKGFEKKDISQRLTEALTELGARGGGAVEIPAGTFFLDRSVVVRQNSVVIRGAGRDKTRLIFRDQIPYGEIRFYNWAGTGLRLNPGGALEFQANPKNLIRLSVAVNGTVFRETSRKDHWGNRFFIHVPGAKALEELGEGKQTLTVTAEYSNREKVSKAFDVTLESTPVVGAYPGAQHGALLFVGNIPPAAKFLLTKDGERGSRTLVLPENHGFKAGDRIEIVAPATARWNTLTGNRCPWGTYRANQYELTEVKGAVVTLNQPLRIEFPVIDGSWVRAINPIRNSGVEGLTIEQQVQTTKPEGPMIRETLWYPMDDLWTNGISFAYAWGCWARDVRVINSGRNPIYLVHSKFSEARNAECNGAIFKGGGGTGYVGIEESFDCLMDSITTRGMRHAPDLQWGAAGNVVRASSFYGSDGQWHAGWTNENLFENNYIELSDEDFKNWGEDMKACYGYGLFATGPMDTVHGPQGPRNVVYGNDVVAPKDALHMQGGNEAWIIVYNRFRTSSGYAVYGKEKTFDHLIKGNVFAIRNPKGTAVYFEGMECVGVDVIGNRFYGKITELTGFREGRGKIGQVRENQILAWTAEPPKPVAPVESIYLWQRSPAAKSFNNKTTKISINQLHP